ncbi:MAG: thiamine pyrophosphate-binding protein [Candidatus Competibacteraceae bacterium]
MRVADYVAQKLTEAGVRHIFMLPGGAAMHLNDAFGRQSLIEPVGNLHEQACAIAAEACARVTGGLGAALVTAGPGGTNAITGLAGAWLDSTPVIFLSGQVKRADLKGARGVRQYGVQEIDIVRIVDSLTKYAVTIIEPESIRYHVEKALYLATTGRRGPVWLEFPLDVQGAEVEPEKLVGFTPESGTPVAGNLAEETAQAIRLFNEAQRPVLLAGHGVRMAGAVETFRQFVEHWQIPVLTTWLAMDLLEAEHPLFFGRPGGMAPRGANFTVQNADFLLVIGSRLDLGLVGYSYENFARAARKVIVDIDPTEIAKLPIPVDVPIVADARVFLTEALRQSDRLQPQDRSTWLERCETWKTRYPLLTSDHTDPSQPLSAYYFSQILSEEMRPDDVVVPGSSGFACEIFMLMYQYKKGQRMFHNRGTGAMGFGLPAGIGACLGAGRRRTICVDGDGGFQLNIQELETVRRLDLPIKFFVIDNDGFASIRSSQSGYFNQLVCADPSSGLTLPAITKVAAAYGLASCRIEGLTELRERIQQVLDTPGPIVCEVVVRPDEPRIPRLASYRKPDGSMVSRPIEDLFPFLDRKEFQENMLIPTLPE